MSEDAKILKKLLRTPPAVHKPKKKSKSAPRQAAYRGRRLTRRAKRSKR